MDLGRQHRQRLEKQIRALQAALPEKFESAARTGSHPDLKTALESWTRQQQATASHWKGVAPLKWKTNLPRLEVLPDQSVFASGDFTKRDVYQLEFEFSGLHQVAAIRLEVLPDPRLPAGGPGNAYYEGRKGDFFLSEFSAVAENQSLKFSRAETSFGKISIGNGSADGKNVYDGEGSTGWSTAGQEGRRNQLVLVLDKPVKTKSLSIEMVFERHFVASLGRFRVSISGDAEAKVSPLPYEVEQAIAARPGSTAGQRQRILEHFLLQTPFLKKEQEQIRELEKRLPRSPQTMVMRERHPDHPRKTFRHHRGEYLSPREEVRGQLLSLFPGFEEGVEPNRLNFARWLVSDRNPLAARVTVNRFWQSLFGSGLVATSGDFGTQGAVPTHPELLDWLAVHFQENGWSRKKLLRLIVMSSTYRQSSLASEEDYRMDPSNESLSRGPRFRVSAETVRDIVLAASGKLSAKMYGPSVYPPQPASVTALAYGGTRWPTSKGEDRFRRSLYTFSKRTAPFAAYLTFNGPTGENCVARRNRSNSPLQALTVLNDGMFVELARHAALLAMEKSGPSQREMASFLFRRFVTRPAQADEMESLLAFYRRQLDRFQKGELSSEKIAGPESTNELAAWVLVARSIMSLDEVITKP